MLTQLAGLDPSDQSPEPPASPLTPSILSLRPVWKGGDGPNPQRNLVADTRASMLFFKSRKMGESCEVAQRAVARRGPGERGLSSGSEKGPPCCEARNYPFGRGMAPVRL